MIDREKVLKGLECCSQMNGNVCRTECPYSDECIENECVGTAHLCANALELLKEQPKQRFFVDSDGKMTPLPVQKHGHWIRPPKFLSESQCSVCKETHVGDYRMFKFCPDCGARMDEEVEQDG